MACVSISNSSAIAASRSPSRRVTIRVVHGLAGKLFVALLVTLCVAVYLLEMSGRWDRSIQDANDEAGFVAIVLCIPLVILAIGLPIALFVRLLLWIGGLL